MKTLVLAYLDAGTGSLILQLLVGGFAGAAVFVKYRWGNLKSWFRRGEKTEQ